jgi:hypothetical protein
MNSIQQLRVQLFNLEKNGEHDYEGIKTILSTLNDNYTDDYLLCIASETSDYNDRLYVSNEILGNDIYEDEKVFHGLCYRMRMLQMAIMKQK